MDYVALFIMMVMLWGIAFIFGSILSDKPLSRRVFFSGCFICALIAIFLAVLEVRI